MPCERITSHLTVITNTDMGSTTKNILVVALVLLNIATLATIWTMAGGKGSVVEGSRKERPSQTDFLANELNFDDAQREALEKLRREHFKEMKQEHNRLRELRGALHEGLGGSALNEQMADSLATALGKQFGQMELLVVHHFRDIRALCSEAQQPLFDDIVEEVLRMGPPEGHRPPGGPPPHRRH